MERDYKIFLEIQRGGTESRKAWEKQHPEVEPFDDYVNVFDLIKVYGAGWLGVPGIAFSKNLPFLPSKLVYEKMVSRESAEPEFGARDLYAAYKIKCAADEIGFGRNAKFPSRRLTRFLFCHLLMRMLHSVISSMQPGVPPSALTDAVIKLSNPESKAQLDVLVNSAVQLIDSYMSLSGDRSINKEDSFIKKYNGNMNAFLKADDLGKENHSPLLVQALAIQDAAFGMTHKDSVARALL